MADAVFTACFLNTLNRNSDIVGMACFAPVVNTRGCIFTHRDGIVLRSTYHIFDLYVNYLGDEITDSLPENIPVMDARHKDGHTECVDVLDILPTRRSADGMLAVAAVNKHPSDPQKLILRTPENGYGEYRVITVNGESTESYNGIGLNGVTLTEGEWQKRTEAPPEIDLPAHSVNVIQMR